MFEGDALGQIERSVQCSSVNPIYVYCKSGITVSATNAKL
jgi:hypothetical protein